MLFVKLILDQSTLEDEYCRHIQTPENNVFDELKKIKQGSSGARTRDLSRVKRT